MSTAHYLLQVNIYLIIFYGFYQLFLTKETYFKLNRAYLLSSGIFSLIIPFLGADWFSSEIVNQGVYLGVAQLNGVMELADSTQDDKLSWGNIILLIYLFGLLFWLGRFLFQLLTLKRLLRNNANGHAFSFFNVKQIDPALPGLQVIQKHEDIHIHQLHSLDVVFFELLGAMVWFNPVIYLYKSTIKHVHEFLADEKAAEMQGSKQEYALLLLSNALGVSPLAITNSFFNQSLIKKRIYMLNKRRSKKTAVLKYGIFLPLFALALVLSSATIRQNEKLQAVSSQVSDESAVEIIERISTPAAIIKPKPIAKLVPRAVPADQDTLDKVLDFVAIDKQPSFPGGMKKFYEYLSGAVKYPALAQENNIQGKVYLSFVVEKDGSLTNIKIDRRLGSGTDEEALRVIRESPKWIPGMQGDKVVRVKYNIPITFTLSKPANTTDSASASQSFMLRSKTATPPLILLDGRKISIDEMSKIDRKKIESVNIIKEQESLKVYGDAGKHGVILIASKRSAQE